MAKKKKGSVLLWIIIIVLVFILFKDKIFVGGGSDICGERGKDEERGGYCNVLSSDYDALIFVVGNTQNSPRPNIDFEDEKMSEIIEGVFYGTEKNSTVPISVISVSGNNKSIEIDNINKLKPGNNLNTSRNNIKKLKKEINKAIEKPADEDGADYFGAILKAKSEIRKNNSKHGLIYVVGSGYSDRGVLDFTQDILGKYSDSNDIVSIIGNNESVKKGDFESIDVRWYEIGETVSPQRSLSSHYKALTKRLYGDLFEYLGAEAEINTGSASSVSESVETSHKVGQIYYGELQVGDTVDLNENIARFEVNSPKLLNYDEVKGKLRLFVSSFSATSNVKLKITGYIAICSPGSTTGIERAATIKDMLVELGVPYERIEIYGQPGAPTNDGSEGYVCENESLLAEEERRTVRIVVTGL